ncbi:MAG: formylglycine-generating enzyme family protein [bacterium]|nr:formylglycine-generating enzyme family protein [bacterium]
MWYEALAYTRWLAERWREWLPDAPEKWGVRLPSEAEWEKGARGGVQIPAQALIQPISALCEYVETAVLLRENPRNQAAYIWGSARDANRANYKDSGIGSSSAVGCFPGGASPYGVEEMAGNVWEWLNSKHKGYAYRTDDGREVVDASSDGRVLRGGSNYDDPTAMRCAFRGRNYVHDDYGYLGFRVCVSPFLSSLWPLDPLDSVTLKGRR